MQPGSFPWALSEPQEHPESSGVPWPNLPGGDKAWQPRGKSTTSAKNTIFNECSMWPGSAGNLFAIILYQRQMRSSFPGTNLCLSSPECQGNYLWHHYFPPPRSPSFPLRVSHTRGEPRQGQWQELIKAVLHCEISTARQGGEQGLPTAQQCFDSGCSQSRPGRGGFAVCRQPLVLSPCPVFSSLYSPRAPQTQ